MLSLSPSLPLSLSLRAEGKIVGIGGKFFKLNCLSKMKMETYTATNNSFITTKLQTQRGIIKNSIFC
jgi:hypothetical protein